MLKCVYALAGRESLLQLEHLGRILSQAPQGMQRVDVDGPAAEIGEVIEELTTLPMFAAGKVVVVRRADENEGPRQSFLSRCREPLEKHIRRMSGSSAVLVLRMGSADRRQNLIKAIAAVGEIIDCDTPEDLVAWTADRARRVHGLAMAPAAAGALVERIGADLGRIDNELAKLALQCEGQADEQAVLRSVTFQREQEIKELTEALSRGDVPLAIRRWRRLLQLDPTAQYRAATWLLMWLEDVRAVLTPATPFKNAWRYKQFAGEFRRFAAALGPAKVGRLIDLLAEADWRSKRGLGDAASNIERFLLAVGE